MVSKRKIILRSSFILACPSLFTVLGSGVNKSQQNQDKFFEEPLLSKPGPVGAKRERYKLCYGALLSVPLITNFTELTIHRKIKDQTLNWSLPLVRLI